MVISWIWSQTYFIVESHLCHLYMHIHQLYDNALTNAFFVYFIPFMFESIFVIARLLVMYIKR